MSIQNLDGVAHYWANQVEDQAKTGNGSFSFNGATLTSYSTDIARLYNDNSVVLITNTRYSVTTARHLSKAQEAANHKQVFMVPDIGEYNYNFNRGSEYKIDHNKNLQYFKDSIKEYILKSSRARANKLFNYDQAVNFVTYYNEYLIAFKIKRKPITIEQYSPEKILEQANKQRKAAKAKKEKQARELHKKNAVNRAQWLNNETNNFNNSWSQPVYLRVNGDNIETSKSANIPVKFAPVIWKLIKRTMASKEQWSGNNTHSFKVGVYSLDRINVNGDIRVGCHDIPYSELKRIAELLGYL